MIGIGEWRRPKEFPKGALKTVSSGTMCVFSSIFIDNSTVQLEWLTSTPWPNSSISSFSTPSFVICDKTLTMSIIRLQHNHVDLILPSSPLERTKCRQGSMRGGCQQTETAALSMQVNPQAPPSSDVPVHLMIPSLSAPLPKTKGRFCTPLKDPG